MKLALERLQRDADVTIGSLTVDGDWECWTLEDAVREVPGQPVSSWKIAGQTAIPAGTYPVTLTQSARFKRILPSVDGVPGFVGIRIHAGNTAADTEGCILVGGDRWPKSIGHSQVALAALMTKIGEALRKGERVTLTVQ